MKIGVLALQGAFREHKQMLESLGADVQEVRLPKHLKGLQGLIIPGGESTTMAKLMMDYGLKEPIQEFYGSGGGVWGTCAGAILMATDITGYPEQPRLGLLPMQIARNAFGRQVDSFKTPLDIKGLSSPFEAVFIRAPIIEKVPAEVEILATYEEQIVLVHHQKLLACSFHPELTHDNRLHQLFLDLL